MILRGAMTYNYIQDSIVNMREKSSLQSKVVSQAVFSEKVTASGQEGMWVRVTSSDGYTGWVPSTALCKRESLYEGDLFISRLSAHLYSIADIEYGPLQTLPYGVSLQLLEVLDERWFKVTLPNGEDAFIQKGDVILDKGKKNKQELPLLSKQFQGLPYTWGGRSSFGYDCSGFIQMLYQEMGVSLERDSQQQSIDPRFETSDVSFLNSGDLIFFGYAIDQVRHVGMALGEGTFIHATSRENQPWIRISRFSDYTWSGDPNCLYPCRFGRRITV